MYVYDNGKLMYYLPKVDWKVETPEKSPKPLLVLVSHYMDDPNEATAQAGEVKGILGGGE